MNTTLNPCIVDCTDNDSLLRELLLTLHSGEPDDPGSYGITSIRCEREGLWTLLEFKPVTRTSEVRFMNMHCDIFEGVSVGSASPEQVTIYIPMSSNREKPHVVFSDPRITSTRPIVPQ